MIVKCFLDGIEINDPLNLKELGIKIAYNKGEVTQSLNINSWEFGVSDARFPNDAVNIINNFRNKGLVGGVGVMEGLPYLIQLDNEMGTVYTLFDGYIDVSSAKVEIHKITAPAVEQGNLNWLANRVDGFTFEFLFEQNIITRSDFIPIPYVINKKQHASENVIAYITIIIVTGQLAVAIKELRKSQVGSTNGLQFMDIVKLILDIIFVVTLFISLVNLIFELYKTMVQPVKYHYGMYVKDLLRIGFAHLGLKFQSSILNTHPFNKLYILPEKYNLQEVNTGLFANVIGNLKVNTNEKVGFYKGTFGQLLSEMINFFNAKTGVDNGTYFLEHPLYNPSTPKLQLPPVEDSGFEYNSDEFVSNFLLTYLTDSGDRNTIQEYQGTSCQVIIEPKTIKNKKMVLTKGLDRTTFNFALGKRKTELNYLEELIEGLTKEFVIFAKETIKIINLAISTVNIIISKINSLVKTLNNLGIKVSFSVPSIPRIKTPEIINQIDGSRLNMLKMESDFVNVPKLLMVENKVNPRNNVLSPNMEVFLSAKYMWDNFHKYKSFAIQSDGKHNQYLKYNLSEIAFTFEDFEKVRRSNKIFTSDNLEALIEDLDFNPIKGTATGSYKVNKVYTTNLKETIIEPDGK